jgi:hypothetical protein
MNKKSTGPIQAPAYLTKVKKEKTTKTKSFVNESGEDHRHEKINFKQYLRNIKEQQNSDDEYSDVPLLNTNSLVKEDIRDADDLLEYVDRFVDFGDSELKLLITEADFEAIQNLDKDDSITIYTDDYRWYASRSLNNQIVFECQEISLSGKLNFDNFIKRFK